MSLNTIELTELIIAELYRDSLLVTEPLPRENSPARASGGKTAIPAGPAIPADAIIPGKPARPSVPPPPVTAKEWAITYKFLGNNGRKITLLVNAPGVPYLPDDQLAFLTKMLEACKMNMGDVALVNHAVSPVMIGALKQQLQPSVLVLFGIEPPGIHLPVNFPLYHIQAYDGCEYLYASPLEELVKPTEEGKLLKTKLWVCLKQLFGV